MHPSDGKPAEDSTPADRVLIKGIDAGLDLVEIIAIIDMTISIEVAR